MPAGRPPSPPRTDPAEIVRNRSKKTEETFERAKKKAQRAYPAAEMAPTEQNARAAARRIDAARILGKPVSEEDVAEVSRATDEMSPKDYLTKEELDLLGSSDTCPNTLLAKSFPKRPAWVETAFVESVAVVKEQFGRAPNMRLALQMVTPATMLEPTHDGVTSLYAYAAWVTRQFRRFAASVPLPSDYSDLFMTVVIPTFNAVSIDSRRCLDCGQVFALRAAGKKKDEELKAARYCPVCYPTASERDRVRKRGRKRPVSSGQAIVAELAKLKERHRRHFQACQFCKAGRECELSAFMHTHSDALNRMHEQLTEKHDRAVEPEEDQEEMDI